VKEGNGDTVKEGNGDNLSASPRLPLLTRVGILHCCEGKTWATRWQGRKTVPMMYDW